MLDLKMWEGNGGVHIKFYMSNTKKWSQFIGLIIFF